jgi:hypothetical protein
MAAAALAAGAYPIDLPFAVSIQSQAVAAVKTGNLKGFFPGYFSSQSYSQAIPGSTTQDKTGLQPGSPAAGFPFNG